MMSRLSYTIVFGNYYRLTTTNICSIIVCVRKKKKKPIASLVLAYLHDRLFQIHTYKFVVQNGLELETQQKRYAILLLHINFKLVKINQAFLLYCSNFLIEYGFIGAWRSGITHHTLTVTFFSWVQIPPPLLRTLSSVG